MGTEVDARPAGHQQPHAHSPPIGLAANLPAEEQIDHCRECRVCRYGAIKSALIATHRVECLGNARGVVGAQELQAILKEVAYLVGKSHTGDDNQQIPKGITPSLAAYHKSQKKDVEWCPGEFIRGVPHQIIEERPAIEVEQVEQCQVKSVHIFYVFGFCTT